MAIQYTVTAKNDSQISGSVCLFQRLPKQEMYQNIYVLAWLTKFCHPGTIVKTSWNPDYCFFWSTPGPIRSNIYLESSETAEADPTDTSKNSILLTKESGAYHFAKPPHAANPGNLDIITDDTIPISEAVIGIGMDKNASLATQAMPNMIFSFIPKVEYWIAFGNFVEGQVIGPDSLSNATEIIFPINIYDKNYSFGADNLWHDLGN